MIEQAILIDTASGTLLIEDANSDIEEIEIQDVHVAIVKLIEKSLNSIGEVEIKENGITTKKTYEIPEYKETIKIMGTFLLRKSIEFRDREINKTIIRLTDGYIVKSSDEVQPFYVKNKKLELLHCKPITISDETVTLQKVEFECNQLYYIEEEPVEEITDQLLK